MVPGWHYLLLICVYEQGKLPSMSNDLLNTNNNLIVDGLNVVIKGFWPAAVHRPKITQAENEKTKTKESDKIKRKLNDILYWVSR